jgi:hypothetical protein
MDRLRKKKDRHAETILQAANLALQDKQRVYNCELHAYKPFNKTKCTDMFRRFDFREMNVPYALNTLYRNLYDNITMTLDNDAYKFVCYLHWVDGYHHYVPDKAHEITQLSTVYDMCSYNDLALNSIGGMLKKWLQSNYPVPSRFERF